MGDIYGATILQDPADGGPRLPGLDTTHLIYVTSSVYDPAEEGRRPHDDPEIGYDFVSSPPVT